MNHIFCKNRARHTKNWVCVVEINKLLRSQTSTYKILIMFLKQRASTVECGRSSFHPGTQSFEKLPLIKVVDQEGERGRRKKETESAQKKSTSQAGSCILCVGPLCWQTMRKWSRSKLRFREIGRCWIRSQWPHKFIFHDHFPARSFPIRCDEDARALPQKQIGEKKTGAPILVLPLSLSARAITFHRPALAGIRLSTWLDTWGFF